MREGTLVNYDSNHIAEVRLWILWCQEALVKDLVLNGFMVP